MAGTKKFTVVKLTAISEQCANPYRVVPTSWIRYEFSDFSKVKVPYPPEDRIRNTFDLILKCQPPLHWDEYEATVEYETDTYEAGMAYIKRNNRRSLEEETLLQWLQRNKKFLDL